MHAEEPAGAGRTELWTGKLLSGQGGDVKRYWTNETSTGIGLANYEHLPGVKFCASGRNNRSGSFKPWVAASPHPSAAPWRAERSRRLRLCRADPGREDPDRGAATSVSKDSPLH